MKINFLRWVINVIPILIVLAGCQKKLDVSDEEIAAMPLPATGNYCRIESIWENPCMLLTEKFGSTFCEGWLWLPAIKLLLI